MIRRTFKRFSTRQWWVACSSLAVFVVAVLCAAPSQAEIILSNGDVQLFDFNGPATGHPNPPLIDITRLSLAGGRVFTNQVTGSPFALGSTVRTIGVMTIGSAINGTNIPATLPNTTNLNVIFAVEGTIISTGTVVNVKFDAGRALLLSDTTGNSVAFEINHPSTWNFGNQFAEFRLLPQQFVIDGSTLGITGHGGTTADGSGHISFPPSSTNVSGVNTAVQAASQGVFLLGEDSTAAQNAGTGFTNPGLGTFTGNNFLRNVDAAPTVAKLLESVVAVTNQTALGTLPVTLTSSDLTALDSIAVYALGAGKTFTAGGYTPTGLGAGTGDFMADLTGDVYVGYYGIIPEPGSLVMSLLGMGGMMAVGVVRRLRSRKNEG
jgi:hypothetical protein